MAQDRNGKIIAKGSLVSLPCIVTEIKESVGAPSRLVLASIERMPNGKNVTRVVAAASQVELITAPPDEDGD